MRKVYQYRYVKGDIFPTDLTPGALITGSFIADKTPIYQLGIQSLPGTKFYLNASTSPIIIGSTGIYELDLQEKSTISALRFDEKSISALTKNMETSDSYLIVDIIYEEGD